MKTASPVRINGHENLPRHVYADPVHKLYPCHSAPATWFSALYFADKQAEFKTEQARAIREHIHKAAEFFGVLGSIKDLEEKMAALNNDKLAALDDSAFAIVWEVDGGETERHWPLRNSTEVKLAATHFRKYRDEFVFLDRRTIADKILTKAAEYDADISDHMDLLLQSAGRGYCAAKTASEVLRNRATLVRRANKSAAESLSKLAAAVDQNPAYARSPEVRVKMAAAVDEFDRANHLYRLYDDGGLPRPEETFFAVTEKMAREFTEQNVETTTGNVYALTDLEKLAVDDVRAWLGDDFAEAVTAGGVYLDRDKLAAIVPTLDRGMAATLDRLLQEQKIAAVAYTKAAHSLLSLDRLREIAAQAG